MITWGDLDGLNPKVICSTEQNSERSTHAASAARQLEKQGAVAEKLKIENKSSRLPVVATSGAKSCAALPSVEAPEKKNTNIYRSLATMSEPAPTAKPRLKDLTGVTQAAPYLPYDTLSGILLGPSPAPSPSDNGTISLTVLRPAVNLRRVVDEVEMSVTGGMAGSGWVEKPERGTIDQICVMSTTAIRAIAGDDMEKWPAAGDQLFMDLDLGKGNLKTGDRVMVGREGAERDVVLEVTSKPHNGCSKFSRRYGADALKIVNAPLGKERRLRGIYFRVVMEGVIRTGDRVVKLPREE